MRMCCTLFALLFTIPASFSQTTTLKTEIIERDIVFIYGAGADGHVDKNHPLGTGFFISVPRKTDNTVYVLLATARHVVDPKWAHCSTANPEKVFYRINKKSFDPTQSMEGVGYVELPLGSGANRAFVVGPREDVDAALIQLPPTAFSQNDYDVLFMSVNEMASSEESKQLGVGDMVASAGLLPGASGQNRNYPLFKFGYVSALPEENIEVQCVPGGPTRAMRLWLGGANLSPGASGSPIIYIPSIIGGSRVAIGRGVFIGIQSMSFLLADVAGITPIGYVFDILESMHLPGADLYRGSLPAPASTPNPKPN